MNPDTPETRINRLEMQVVALEGQVKEVREDVRTLESVKERLTRIEEQVKQVREGLGSLQSVIVDDRAAAKVRGVELAKEIQDMREAQTADQKASRRQLIAAAVSIITTLLLIGGGVITALLSGP